MAEYTDRIVTPVLQETDQAAQTLRPKCLKDYIGQSAICEQMTIFIQAAQHRGDAALEHVMLLGPPGLGKTTLGNIIAHELGVNLRHTSGPVLERAGDIAALLTNMQKGDVLFIDEIHRLSPAVEEALYPAMEDYQIDIIIGEGPAARSVKLTIPPFTLVGATTRAGLLTSPLRDRFGIIHRLEFYPTSDLIQIVLRSASILNITIQAEAAEEIAKRARGTPRIVNRLLRRVRDYAAVKANYCLSKAVVQDALDFLKVDHQGLDLMDHKLLFALIEHFQGGPVGLETLAALLNEEKGTVEEVIEPFLLQQGFILRTRRGRLVSAKTYQHFGLCVPNTLPSSVIG